MRLLAAVYRWHRDVYPKLPEWSKNSAEIHDIKPQDWAFTDDELRVVACEKEREDKAKGVSTLGTMKRMWWLTALFTGARKGSIEALRWADLDIEKKVLHFRVAKGDQT